MAKKSVIKRKKGPSIAIPLVLALIVALLFYKGAERQAQAEIQPMQVPIAIERLKEHTEITEEHISMITIPARGVPPNIIVNPDELIGKYVGSRYTIPQNGYFYQDAISNFEDIPSRLPMMLGPNELGITMRMNLEKSVANSLQDGQYVQVRFFTDKTPNRLPLEGVLEEKIKILSLRDSSGVDVSGTDDEQSRVPTIVVFEASEEQVSYLLRAQALGELNIVAISDDLYKEDTPSQDEKEKDNDIEDEGESRTEADALVELLDTINQYITQDQQQMLEEITGEYIEGKGSGFAGNEIKLYIDSMTFRLENMFDENKMLKTPAGEIVYYDEETGQIRYFANQKEYDGSAYALEELSEEEIGELEDVSEKAQDTLEEEIEEGNEEGGSN